MKNEYVKIQVIFVFMAVAIVGASYSLVFSPQDELSFTVFMILIGMIIAAGFFFERRLARRAAVVCPVPGGDPQPLVSKISEILASFGFQSLAPAAAGRWGFEAKPIDFAGKPLKAGRARTVSIEIAGPALLRVEGSRVLLKEIGKQVAGTVASPYMGPQQPSIVRGKMILIMCLFGVVLVLLYGKL